MPDIRPFLVTGVALGSIYAMSGLGLVVLFRATSTVNFAYGAAGALGALVAWDLIGSGVPQVVAWLACLVVSTLLSLAYGMVVSPRLADRDLATKAIATVGFALLLLGFGLWYWPDIPRSLDLPTSDWGFRVLGVRVVGTKVLALVLVLMVGWGVTFFLDRTRTGLHMRAMADDPEHADMLGIRTDRVGAVAWAISGALGGLSGLLIADLVRLEVVALTFLVVSGLAAAVVGRLESLPLTAVGGVVIGVLESVAAPFESISRYRGVTPFVAAIAFIAWRQRGGLLRRRTAAL